MQISSHGNWSYDNVHFAGALRAWGTRRGVEVDRATKALIVFVLPDGIDVALIGPRPYTQDEALRELLNAATVANLAVTQPFDN